MLSALKSDGVEGTTWLQPFVADFKTRLPHAAGWIVQGACASACAVHPGPQADLLRGRDPGSHQRWYQRAQRGRQCIVAA